MAYTEQQAVLLTEAIQRFLGAFINFRRPMAAAYEIVRQQKMALKDCW